MKFEFVETEILLAALDADFFEVQNLVRYCMTNTERQGLREACEDILEALDGEL